MVSVLFVCLGNICRSPLAEALFLKHLKDLNIESEYKVDSAGTASFHLGELADKRTRQMALKIDNLEILHRARQFKTEDFFNFDFIVAMDKSNLNNILKMKPSGALSKVVLMRQYDTMIQNEETIPDPYYGNENDFEEVHYMLSDCTLNFLKKISNERN